jgi:hypothetical protein
LSHGKLLAHTDQGTLQCIHPESGRTLWTVSVGSANYPSQPPSTNGKFTAMTNGTTLYVYDAETGAEIWRISVSGSPCAGSAMNDMRVYVPLDNGLLESYLLVRSEGKRELFDRIPKRYSGAGGAVTAPVVVGKRVSWCVAQGFVYSAEETFKDLVQFRFRADSKLNVGPAAMPSMLFVASRLGTVSALNDLDGAERWRFRLGNAISHPIIPIDGAVYAISESGDAVRLDPAVGRQVWYGRGIRQFVSASADRIYAFDIEGRLTSRDAMTGTVLGAVQAPGFDLPCYNTESDRLYLASSMGIVQCLRESQLAKAVAHTPGPPQPAEPAAPGAAPADGTAPAAAEAPAAANPANPFGAGT